MSTSKLTQNHHKKIAQWKCFQSVDAFTKLICMICSRLGSLVRFSTCLTIIVSNNLFLTQSYHMHKSRLDYVMVILCSVWTWHLSIVATSKRPTHTCFSRPAGVNIASYRAVLPWQRPNQAKNFPLDNFLYSRSMWENVHYYYCTVCSHFYVKILNVIATCM